MNKKVKLHILKSIHFPVYLKERKSGSIGQPARGATGGQPARGATGVRFYHKPNEEIFFTLSKMWT